MMMKKLVGTLGVLAALGILSYPGFGLLVEKGLEHQIQLMPKQYGMQLELKDFQRHWFFSEAQLSWKWDIPAHLKQNAQGQTITVSPKHYEKEIHLHIYHGPLVLHHWKPFLGVGYAATQFNWPFTSPDQTTPNEFSAQSIFPKIDVTMALDFFLHTHWQTEVPPFKLIAKDQHTEMNWGGLIFNNTLSANLQKIQGKLQLKNLAIKKPQTTVVINQLDTNYHFKLSPVGIYVGDADFSLKHAASGSHLSIDNIKIQNHAAVQNEMFSTHFDAALKSATIDGMKWGPFHTIVDISQINAPALLKAQAQLKAQQNASPSFRNKGFLTVIAALPELLKFGAKVDITEFHMVLNDGFIDSHLSLNLPADDSAGSMLNFQRLQALNGDAEFKISKTLLKNWLVDVVQKQMKSQQQLAMDAQANTVTDQDILQAANARTNEKLSSLIQAGVLKEQKNIYSISLKLQNSQVTINQLPFDPAWLYF